MAKIEIEKPSQNPPSWRYPRFAKLNGVNTFFAQFNPDGDWHCLSDGCGWKVGDVRDSDWMPSGNILPPGTKLHITVE